MSQTRSQRRAEQAGALRRSIVKMIKRHITAAHLADIDSGLVALGCDELLVVERIAIALVPFGDDLAPALITIVTRLLKGRADYGELDLAMDPRNWAREMAEENADRLIYGAIRSTARMLDGAKAGCAYEFDLWALSAWEVRDLVLLARAEKLRAEVRNIERSPADEPHCAGSTLLFGPLSTRIVDDVYTLHCHQCAATWPASAIPMRAGEELVIPHHRRVPR